MSKVIIRKHLFQHRCSSEEERINRRKISNSKSSRKWRLKNPEKIKKIRKECWKRYTLKYPEKIKLHRKESRISYIWLKKIAERDGYECRNCHITKKLTLQHKIPKCIGGNYSYENLEILCFQCNIKDYYSLVKKALKFYFENKDR
jgi:5-methylcytosine-specific restriction endonuclease McrA